MIAITDVLLPLFLLEGSDESCRDCSDMIGINYNLKYAKKGIEHRRQYESFLKLEGDMVVCDKVGPISFPEDDLTTMGGNDSVTIKLLPFGNEKTFQYFASNKSKRSKPDLDA